MQQCTLASRACAGFVTCRFGASVHQRIQAKQVEFNTYLHPNRGLQEKRLSGVVAEQQGKGEQSSSTQELNESNLSLGNQGMACLACLKELHTLSDIPEVLSFLEELELGKASQAQGTSAKQTYPERISGFSAPVASWPEGMLHRCLFNTSFVFMWQERSLRRISDE
ncbi:hypothetical protein WJX77_010312 [Trebouxia sp. C0004]